MNDPSTLSFSLTYAGIVGVAVLMFLGQFFVFTALLVLTGTASLLARTARVTMRGRRR